MNTYIALLRGINVSGQKLIKMADLKKLIESLGFEKVATYIQSGNIVFRSPETNRDSLKLKIMNALSKKYDFNVPVTILKHEELEFASLNNPFINEKNKEIKFLHITFLERKPDSDRISDLKSIASGNDEFIISGKLIYLFCPDGYGRTNYTNNFFENKLKTDATTRSWKTLNAILELCNSK
ncbi:MAG: DUF1697 domain-containing protein [Prolixibacteraceae bacterium]|nr:DUF1697 domain-containing protein [Prolixibacteraceae bacterium]